MTTCCRCSRVGKIVFTQCTMHHINEIMLVATMTCSCCHCISKIVFPWCTMHHINKIMLATNKTCCRCSQIGNIVFTWCPTHHINEIMLDAMMTCNCCQHISKIVFTWCMMCFINKSCCLPIKHAEGEAGLTKLSSINAQCIISMKSWWLPWWHATVATTSANYLHLMHYVPYHWNHAWQQTVGAAGLAKLSSLDAWHTLSMKSCWLWWWHATIATTSAR